MVQLVDSPATICLSIMKFKLVSGSQFGRRVVSDYVHLEWRQMLILISTHTVYRYVSSRHGLGPDRSSVEMG